MNRKDIKVGDLVEDCSLYPGIVLSISGDDVEIRSMGYETGTGFCSLKHCGIMKLTRREFIARLGLDLETLTELYQSANSWEEYNHRIIYHPDSFTAIHNYNEEI